MDLGSMEPRSGRMTVFLVVFFTWVAIYLPALGARELRGEEGRRVLPAVSMLKTGDWLVPQIGGEAYYRKPPLINWLVASSFLLTGEQTEHAARLPSVLFLLAFAAAIVWLGGPWLRLEARLIAAVIFLTSVAVIEKGRQIEIEAVYISQTSLALLFWLTLWAGGRSRWALWLVPSFFLMIGMLTKGPAILVFYYVPVIGVLAYSRRLRALVSLPHLASLAVSLGIPAFWAYLALVEAARHQTAAHISGELVARLTGLSGGWAQWTRNAAKSFVNLLPWAAFLPLLWRRDFLAHLPAERLPLLKGARLGLVLSFLAITFIPGNSPRYGLPALGLMSLLLGWVLAEAGELPDRGRLWRGFLLACFGAAGLAAVAGFVGIRRDLWAAVVLCGTACLALLAVREREAFSSPVRLALLSAALAVVLMIQYALFAPVLMVKAEKRRPVAAEVNALVPEPNTLYVFKPGYQAFLFYLREPFEYLVEPPQIDQRVRFLLLREDAYQTLKEDPVLAARQPRTLYCFPGHTFDFRLLELRPQDRK
jgi:4-amino-4-deoxy-L-arabinose transferase-like glycosyltransferase